METVEAEGRTLEGVLIAVAWESSGEVVELALTTFDEREYRIDPETARRHGLRDHLRKHVRLTGQVLGGRVTGVERLEVLGNGGERVAPD